MRRVKIKMGIQGEEWAERLRRYSCSRLVRLFYTARRLCRTNSLVWLTISAEFYRRVRSILSDVACRKVLPLDRLHYLATAQATVISSMDDVPWHEFCHWVHTVALTEAYSVPRFWDIGHVAGFVSEQRLHHMATLDRFLERLGYELGSQARAVAQAKMEGCSDTHIADMHTLPLDHLRDLLAEIADFYRKCQCTDLDNK